MFDYYSPVKMVQNIPLTYFRDLRNNWLKLDFSIQLYDCIFAYICAEACPSFPSHLQKRFWSRRDAEVKGSKHVQLFHILEKCPKSENFSKMFCSKILRQYFDSKCLGWKFHDVTCYLGYYHVQESIWFLIPSTSTFIKLYNDICSILLTCKTP